jgi:two-component system sensor histidine kinase HydH
MAGVKARSGDPPPPERPAGAAEPARPRSSAWTSPARQFALLSLLSIGGSTLVFGIALSYFVERAILDREWASTAALVRTAARFYLRPENFAADAVSGEADDRFEELSRQVRMLPEIARLVVYDTRGRPLWLDTERGTPAPAPDTSLSQALAGETSVRLVPPAAGASERVEVYVPITFPGEGRVAGVIQTQVDPSRVLASVRRARWYLWTLAVLSGAVLYAALYGIVWRASRALRAQHEALARRADELARANAELTAVQQQLVATERLAAFGEITAAVAHGLGNPLAAIRGMAQLAQVESHQTGVRQRLEHVIAQADRLSARMRALLRLGRPMEQRPIPVALDRAVHVALESVRPRCVEAGVRLETVLPPDLPKARLDPAGFEEALLCLVTNALDAMADGGVLRVLAHPPAPGTPVVQLVVEDTGPGIPAPVLRQVFEPFFTTKPNGTGLGLALARKLLEATGARLELDSEPGRGTRAVLALPIDEG